MVQELRRITLTTEELISALECYNRMKPNFLPATAISDIRAVDRDSIRIEFHVVADDYDLSASMTMRSGRLLHPVIRYCVENNICLPTGGRKSIEIEGDCVTLCIAIDSDFDVSDGFFAKQIALNAMAISST